IFPVNGDDPEACLRAIRLAYEFRQQFSKDVVIDMLCYRRHGHNEGDEPSLTQPRMYKAIKEHRSVRKIYTEQLLRKGDIDPKEAEQWLDAFQAKLQDAFDRTRDQKEPPSQEGQALWTDEEVTGFQKEPSPDTAVPRDRLATVGRVLSSVPENFTPHPKLKPILAKRQAMAEGREPMDWAFAELMAFGTVMLDGFRVRLSGQDSSRGTFSSRHALLFDYVTGNAYAPLNSLAHDHSQTPADPVVLDNSLSQDTHEPNAEVTFSAYDSLLSEYGVL